MIIETGPGGKKRVFVIHGHDLKQKENLRAIIDSLGAAPVILQDETEPMAPMLSKFQREADSCSCAIAILTPDDAMGNQHRARQNVIFEIGWFCGRKGSERVLMLYRGTLDIPSDLAGVDHQKFANDVRECAEAIAKFLHRIGVI